MRGVGFWWWQAVAAASSMVEGSVDKQLKKFLTKHVIKKELKDKLAVADKALGGAIKDTLNIKVTAPPPATTAPAPFTSDRPRS